MAKLHVMGGTSNPDLTQAICKHLSIEQTDVTVGRFNDGEVKVQLNENVRGGDVFIVNATNPPAENIIELMLLGSTARYSSAERVTLVIPYLGYNRQDRKDRPRVPVSAKVAIQMLELSQAHRALLVDLHSEPTAAHFNMVTDHIYASYNVIDYLAGLLGKNFVVAGPDATAGVRARKYASHLGQADVVIFDKKRTKPGEVEEESIKIIGDVNGRDVLFIDDMIDTGGTLIADAKAAKAAGARNIYAYAPHAIFSRGVSGFTSELFTEIIVTDTIAQKPDVLAGAGARITVRSIAPLLAKAINRIHHGESLTQLILK